jgi:hypothetical protein
LASIDASERKSLLNVLGSRTFGKIHLKSPPMVHHDDDSSNSDNPHLTPSKRRYPNTFNNDSEESVSLSEFD